MSLITIPNNFLNNQESKKMAQKFKLVKDNKKMNDLFNKFKSQMNGCKNLNDEINVAFNTFIILTNELLQQIELEHNLDNCVELITFLSGKDYLKLKSHSNYNNFICELDGIDIDVDDIAINCSNFLEDKIKIVYHQNKIYVCVSVI